MMDEHEKQRMIEEEKERFARWERQGKEMAEFFTRMEDDRKRWEREREEMIANVAKAQTAKDELLASYLKELREIRKGVNIIETRLKGIEELLKAR